MADKGLVAELYADATFWEKLGKHTAQAGPQLVHKALVLYYTMNNRKTPNRIKASIMGALAYFVLPLDAVPDAIIGVGYLDDLGVIAWAYDTTFNHINDAALKDASRAWKRLVGSTGTDEYTTPAQFEHRDSAY
jgi:uncharacterized membrane protein YkvA (DUF1232 family)